MHRVICIWHCKSVGGVNKLVPTNALAGHHTLMCVVYTDMRRLATGIRFEKRVVRRFRRCANVIEYTYSNLDSIAYYTPSLYIAYCF
jgi:hypothetical protein